MPYRSYSAPVLDAFRREAADRVNRARDRHFETVDINVPVLTGALKGSQEKGPDATLASLSTSVSIGGQKAPHAVPVNDGHILRNGTFLPGQHFWEGGEEAGRKEMTRPL
jgi:hypothetical protein